MSTFEIGQKVRIIRPLNANYKGKVGTITYTIKSKLGDEDLYFVTLPQDDNYIAFSWEVKPIPEADQTPKLIVYLDDSCNVCAKYLLNGKTAAQAAAKCHPDDKFNFLTGAQVAIQRLVAKYGSDFVFTLPAGSQILPIYLDTNNKNKTKGDKQNG